jgi:hypothetical protein
MTSALAVPLMRSALARADDRGPRAWAPRRHSRGDLGQRGHGERRKDHEKEQLSHPPHLPLGGALLPVGERAPSDASKACPMAGASWWMRKSWRQWFPVSCAELNAG